MQRSAAQPSNLRRRYQAVQEQKQRNGFTSSSTDTSLDGPNGLELSMHLPKEPYRNRFEPLAAFSPPSRIPTAPQGRSVQAPPRRYRHIRGTREAKRRRDARRNRRKLLAAQQLDEQLSRDIDKTLTSANIYRPPQLRLPASKPSPKPAPPILDIEDPLPTCAPPTPPQLPCLNFGDLGLFCDFPQLATLTPRSLPRTPSPLFTPKIPDWCPRIPSLVDKRNSKEDMPLFFDLSSLPEPFQTPKPTPKCQALQLWQPKKSHQPPKQSRFFPPRPSSPCPNVKLPATACVLHKSDKGVQVDLPPRTQEASKASVPSQEAVNASTSSSDEQTEASAANLWRILTSKDDKYKQVAADPYVDSFAANHPQDLLSSPMGMFDTRMEAIGMPAELESTEIPYVHANSLTGHGNARAEYPGREIEEHRTVIYDSPMALTPAEEMYAGMNEMVMDYADEDEDSRRYWDA